MNCEKCETHMHKIKIHFLRLPDFLIIQIARMNKEGSLIDETPVEFSAESLDLGPFYSHPDE